MRFYLITLLILFGYNCFSFPTNNTNDQTLELTLQVDMQELTVNKNGVFVKGNWDGWTTPIQMNNPIGSTYLTIITVSSNSQIDYKFYNGDPSGNWDTYQSEDFTGSCTDEWTNRFVQVQDTSIALNVVCFNSCNACSTTPAQTLTIAQVQGTEDTSPFKDQVVQVQGEVTHTSQYGCYIQDANAIRSGIFIYHSDFSSLSIGTRLRVEGTVDEYNRLTEIKDILSSETFNSSYNITPTTLPESSISEDYESMLAYAENVETFNANDYSDWYVKFENDAQILIDNKYTSLNFVAGEKYNITGIIEYRYEEFRLSPRNADDILPVGSQAELVEITFQVDMQNETVSSSGVFLRGSFNNWDSNQTLQNNGTVYYTTLELKPGTEVQYKFVNGDQWEDPEEGACTKSGEYVNRFLIVPDENTTLDTVCFNSCEACNNTSGKVAITFQVDMQNETVSSEGVFLGGDWNSWYTWEDEKVPMEANGSSYTATVEMEPGTTVLYKFKNGDQWETETTGDCSVGDNNDRQLVVPISDTTIDLVCFNSCEACEGEVPQYIVSVTVEPIESGTVSGGGTYNEGETVTVEAIPSEEYAFVNWTINEVELSTAVMYTFDITENVDLVAHFQQKLAKTYTVSVSVFPDGSGSVAGAGMYNEGTTTNISATPNDGYEFVNWTKDGFEQSTNSTFSISVTEDVTYVANFIPIKASDLVEVTFKVDMRTIEIASNGVYLKIYTDDETLADPILMEAIGTFYSTTVELTKGSVVEYNFVNGDPSITANIEYVIDECSTNGHRKLQVPDTDTILSKVCYTSCEVCQPTNNGVYVQVGSDLYGEAKMDGFGRDVAITPNGNHLAVGTEANDGNGSFSGHVRVFEKVDGEWLQIGQDIDGDADYDHSGFSLDINNAGTIVAIGSYGSDGGHGTKESGHTRIFKYNGSEWKQIGGTINAENAKDKAGYSVSLNGDGKMVAIGAIQNDANGTNSGHVRVYRLDETAQNTWTQIGYGNTIAGPSQEYAQFGYSVALSDYGTVLAVGTPYYNGNEENCGMVQVFELSNNQWNTIGNNILGEGKNAQYGRYVELSADGKKVACGSERNNDVKVYELGDNKWEQVGNTLTDDTDNEFGAAIAMSPEGDYLAVSLPGYGSFEEGWGIGKVQTYQLVNGQYQKITASITGRNQNDNFADALSLSSNGQYLAASSIKNSDKISTAGHIRVFEYVAEKLEYNSVTIIANPENGGILIGAGTYKNGTQATVSATSNADYKFIDWKVDDEEVSSDSTYIFEVNKDITLEANFESLPNSKEVFGCEIIYFPNPVDQILYIDGLNDLGKTNCKIINTTGQLLFETEGNDKIQINMETYMAGHYILQIESDKGCFSYPFIKN